MMTNRHTIAAEDVAKARIEYRKHEKRDLFYKAAMALVSLALEKKVDLTVVEALSVLLQTWNSTYYRYHPIDDAYLDNFAHTYSTHSNALAGYRTRSIETLRAEEKSDFSCIFTDFESSLRPVGAAKALHLLAPNLFPLWDRKIARHYGFPLRRTGSNGEHYWNFMLITRELSADLQLADSLKALDEYNYCKYSRGWI